MGSLACWLPDLYPGDGLRPFFCSHSSPFLTGFYFFFSLCISHPCYFSAGRPCLSAGLSVNLNPFQSTPSPPCAQTDLILWPEVGGRGPWLTSFRMKPFSECWNPSITYLLLVTILLLLFFGEVISASPSHRPHDPPVFVHQGERPPLPFFTWLVWPLPIHLKPCFSQNLPQALKLTQVPLLCVFLLTPPLGTFYLCCHCTFSCLPPLLGYKLLENTDSWFPLCTQHKHQCTANHQ